MRSPIASQRQPTLGVWPFRTAQSSFYQPLHSRAFRFAVVAGSRPHFDRALGPGPGTSDSAVASPISLIPQPGWHCISGTWLRFDRPLNNRPGPYRLRPAGLEESLPRRALERPTGIWDTEFACPRSHAQPQVGRCTGGTWQRFGNSSGGYFVRKQRGGMPGIQQPLAVVKTPPSLLSRQLYRTHLGPVTHLHSTRSNVLRQVLTPRNQRAEAHFAPHSLPLCETAVFLPCF